MTLLTIATNTLSMFFPLWVYAIRCDKGQTISKRIIQVSTSPKNHSVHFGVFLSKIVIHYLWLFQIFLAFFNSLYQELSEYVSHISLVLHIYPLEVQEHRLFSSFAWKIRFVLLAQVGKQVKNFTGAHMGTKIQLIMNKLSPTNMPIIKNQVHLVHSKCRAKNVQEILLLEGKIKRYLWNLQNMLKLVLWVIFMISLPISTVFYMKNKNNFRTKISQNRHCDNVGAFY